LLLFKLIKGLDEVDERLVDSALGVANDD